MLQEVDKTFLQEIKVLLQMPEMSSKYIADRVDGNSSMFQLEVRHSLQICFMHYILWYFYWKIKKSGTIGYIRLFWLDNLYV